ncbi:MAG: carbohydrate ABC transporter permease [Thermomicrobiales bacterium]
MNAVSELHRVPRQSRWQRLRRSDLLPALLFASPWIIGFLWFQLYPVAASLYYSFSSYNIMNPPVFIGLDNYRQLFGEDDLFRKALFNTAVFTVISVPLGVTLALVLALLLNRKIPGRSIFRTIFFFPAVVPSVAMAILWTMLSNTEGGLLNMPIKALGFDPIPWLTSPSWSMPSLILLSLWGIGPVVVIFLAGLQDVPQELYESARLDGAGPIRLVRDVTIPLLSPVILFNLIIGMIAALQTFALPFIIFGGYFGGALGGGSLGGPLNSVLMYSVELFAVAFQQFRMGYAAAMAWVLTVIIFSLSLLSLRFSRRIVHYE